MRITASIVTHRTDARELRRCTECVLRCKALTRLDIIDNSPDDALRSAVSNERVHYRHVENRDMVPVITLPCARPLKHTPTAI